MNDAITDSPAPEYKKDWYGDPSGSRRITSWRSRPSETHVTDSP